MKILIIGGGLKNNEAGGSLITFSNFLSEYFDVDIALVRKDGNIKDISNRINNIFYITKTLSKLHNFDQYQLVISFHSFNHKSQIFFEKIEIEKNRKIIWVHTDYEKLLSGKELLKYKYFGKKWKYDVVAVSDQCKASFNNMFRNKREGQTFVMPSLISTDFANKRANSKIIINIASDQKVKGHELLIKILNKVVETGHAISFIQVGIRLNSDVYKQYEKQLDPNLSRKFLGVTNMSWDLIDKADILLITSQAEESDDIFYKAISHGITPIITPMSPLSEVIEPQVKRSKTRGPNEIANLVVEELYNKPYIQIMQDAVKAHNKRSENNIYKFIISHFANN